MWEPDPLQPHAEERTECASRSIGCDEGPSFETRSFGSLLRMRSERGDADQARAAAPPFFFARWMVSHTRSGVAGMSIASTPSGASASITALMTAGGAPIVPDSPMPLTPSGLVLQG